MNRFGIVPYISIVAGATLVGLAGDLQSYTIRGLGWGLFLSALIAIIGRGIYFLMEYNR